MAKPTVLSRVRSSIRRVRIGTQSADVAFVRSTDHQFYTATVVGNPYSVIEIYPSKGGSKWEASMLYRDTSEAVRAATPQEAFVLAIQRFWARPEVWDEMVYRNRKNKRVTGKLYRATPLHVKLVKQQVAVQREVIRLPEAEALYA